MSGVTARPDPRSLTREQLVLLLKELTEREQTVSTERRDLHAQIDALRSELVDRLRDEAEKVIPGSDFVDPGPAGVREPRRPIPRTGSDAVALPRPETSNGDAEATPRPEPPDD